MRICALGAHPDDAEAGCGGTLLRLAAAGHVTSVLYLTRGERGIPGTSDEAAGRIRTSESEASCAILGASAAFFGQIDAATACTQEDIVAISAWMETEKPDLVFAHWPVDTHRDHQIAGVLATRAARAHGIPLAYYEVNRGTQTRCFDPSILVDISKVHDRKREALAAHVSQEGAARIHDEQTHPTETLRGGAAGVDAAEGFVPFDDASGTALGLIIDDSI